MSNKEQDIFDGYEKPPDQVWTIPADEDKSVYRFILAAARRARQLQQGARPLISTTSRKATKIAMEEVKAGMVDVTIPAEGEPFPPPSSAVSDAIDEVFDQLVPAQGEGLGAAGFEEPKATGSEAQGKTVASKRRP